MYPTSVRELVTVTLDPAWLHGSHVGYHGGSHRSSRMCLLVSMECAARSMPISLGMCPPVPSSNAAMHSSPVMRPWHPGCGPRRAPMHLYAPAYADGGAVAVARRVPPRGVPSSLAGSKARGAVGHDPCFHALYRERTSPIRNRRRRARSYRRPSSAAGRSLASARLCRRGACRRVVAPRSCARRTPPGGERRAARWRR